MTYQGLTPCKGRCYNCSHRVRISLNLQLIDLCVQERDDMDSCDGEVYECDRDAKDCPDWRWDGNEL